MINHPPAMTLLSPFTAQGTRLAISRREMKILCLAPHAHPGDGLLDIVFVSQAIKTSWVCVCLTV